MDKKTKFVIGLIICITAVAWVWITYFIEQTTWKATNDYMNELSKYNYEIAKVNSESFYETNLELYKKAYYDRANFFYKNTRCQNAINDYSVALKDCDWDVYDGVCSSSPGLIRRGNCYFKDFKFGLFVKDYTKFIMLHIIRTIALCCTVIVAFCKKFLLIVAPVFLVLITFCYVRYKNKYNPWVKKDSAPDEGNDSADNPEKY